MGLGAALVDRARKLSTVGQGGALPPPVDLDIDSSPLGGTLSAGQYAYAVTVLGQEGETEPATAGVRVDGSEGRVRLFWQPVVGATGYRVYRGPTLDDARLIAEVADPLAVRFIDDGLASSATAPPAFGQAAGRSSGGSVIFGVEGNWFRCRLTLPQGNQQTGPGPRRTAVTVPTLLYGVRDELSDPIVLDIEDRVEIDSPQLGRQVWDVQAMPEPLRKRRTVIGWQVQLQLVQAHEFRQIGEAA